MPRRPSAGPGGRPAQQQEHAPDPADRRARIVQLTPHGQAQLAATRADIRKMETQLLGELSPTEQQTLLSVLPRLAQL